MFTCINARPIRRIVWGVETGAIMVPIGERPIIQPGLVAYMDSRRLYVAESMWSLLRAQRLGPYEEALSSIARAIDGLLAVLELPAVDAAGPMATSLARAFASRLFNMKGRVKS